jgi:chromosome segregation ATPase
MRKPQEPQKSQESLIKLKEFIQQFTELQVPQSTLLAINEAADRFLLIISQQSKNTPSIIHQFIQHHLQHLVDYVVTFMSEFERSKNENGLTTDITIIKLMHLSCTLELYHNHISEMNCVENLFILTDLKNAKANGNLQKLNKSLQKQLETTTYAQTQHNFELAELKKKYGLQTAELQLQIANLHAEALMQSEPSNSQNPKKSAGFGSKQNNNKSENTPQSASSSKKTDPDSAEQCQTLLEENKKINLAVRKLSHELKETSARLKDEIEQLKQTIKHLEKKLQTASESLHNQSTCMTDLKATIAEKDKTIADLERKLNKVKEDFSNHLISVAPSDSHDVLRAQVAQLTLQLAAHQAQAGLYIEHQQFQIVALTKENERLRSPKNSSENPHRMHAQGAPRKLELLHGVSNQ